MYKFIIISLSKYNYNGLLNSSQWNVQVFSKYATSYSSVSSSQFMCHFAVFYIAANTNNSCLWCNITNIDPYIIWKNKLCVIHIDDQLYKRVMMCERTLGCLFNSDQNHTKMTQECTLDMMVHLINIDCIFWVSWWKGFYTWSALIMCINYVNNCINT